MSPTAPALLSAGRALARFPRGWRAAGLATAVTVYLFVVDPSSGGYPPCPTYVLTGTYCPGCGGLRSVHALLHGDLAGSLDRNPAVLPGLVLLAAAGLRWRHLGRPPVRVRPSGWRLRCLLVGVALFWVLRNVPGWAWLSPA